MKKLLLLSLLFISCGQSPVGELSIFELPNQSEFQRWVEYDSLYYQTINTREMLTEWSINDEGKDFFNDETKKLKFANITWAELLEYEKSYSILVGEVRANNIDESASRVFEIADSIQKSKYPLINQFISEVSDWDF